MVSSERSFLWLAVILFFCASSATPGCADDENLTALKDSSSANATAEETEANATAEETEAETEADAFQVPEGTARELFLFINQIKRMQPAERTQEATIAHLRKQVAAVMIAADRILASKISDEDAVRAIEEKFVGLSVLGRVDPDSQQQLLALAKSLQGDPRPSVVHVADFQLLQQEIMKTLQSPGSKASVVTAIFAFIEKYGLNAEGVGLASELSQVLSDKEPEIARQLLARLVPMLEKSGNPDFQAEALKVGAISRRMNLTGNFMELSGVTADGSDFDWKSYRGKFVLIDFWATWCGPCRAEIPNVRQNLAKYGEKGFQVVGINLDQDRAEFDTYMEDAQLPWQNIMPDESGNSEMATYYAVSGIPTVILVDREGKVISDNARGPLLGELLEAHLGDAGDEAAVE